MDQITGSAKDLHIHRFCPEKQLQPWTNGGDMFQKPCHISRFVGKDCSQSSAIVYRSSRLFRLSLQCHQLHLQSYLQVISTACGDSRQEDRAYEDCLLGQATGRTEEKIQPVASRVISLRKKTVQKAVVSQNTKGKKNRDKFVLSCQWLWHPSQLI